MESHPSGHGRPTAIVVTMHVTALQDLQPITHEKKEKKRRREIGADSPIFRECVPWTESPEMRRTDGRDMKPT